MRNWVCPGCLSALVERVIEKPVAVGRQVLVIDEQLAHCFLVAILRVPEGSTVAKQKRYGHVVPIQPKL